MLLLTRPRFDLPTAINKNRPLLCVPQVILPPVCFVRIGHVICYYDCATVTCRQWIVLNVLCFIGKNFYCFIGKNCAPTQQKIEC